MRVIYVCDKCQELHKAEAVVLVLYRNDGVLQIVGMDNLPLNKWDEIIGMLPDMVRDRPSPGPDRGRSGRKG